MTCIFKSEFVFFKNFGSMIDTRRILFLFKRAHRRIATYTGVFFSLQLKNVFSRDIEL